VETDTPAVREYVRGQLALLRAGHPEGCLTCDADGRCELQDLCRAYLVGVVRGEGVEGGAQAGGSCLAATALSLPPLPGLGTRRRGFALRPPQHPAGL
jgi:hypothetical protein